MLDIKKKISSKAESIIFQGDKHKREDNMEKMGNLAKMTHERIYKLSAIFPFDFFPNQVIIEEKQVIIVYKQFFFTFQDYHILIEDILMPIVEQSVFFATLKLEIGPGGFQQNPPPVEFLKKPQALKAKRIIVGLLVCHKEKIDLNGLDKKEMIKKLEEIGRFRSD